METENSKQEKWYQTMAAKMGLLVIMGLLLLIPLQMIKSVIRERAKYADEAKAETGRLWATAQTVTGPVLNVPGTKVINEKGETAKTILHILPESLMVSGSVEPEIRKRGIYESVVYNSGISVSGNFTTRGFEDTDGYTYDWSHAYVTLGVSDSKGIRDSIVLILDGKSVGAEPGIPDDDLFVSGVFFPASLKVDAEGIYSGRFTLKIGLSGSEYLRFTPVGKTTEVNLTSDWPSPSFTGDFLPVERKVTPQGFEAKWVVTHLNRNYPQIWSGARYRPEESAFGVDLMMEVDHYRKAERSAKYGLLFILFTFFVLMVVEIRSSQRIHIFYYMLVSLALILFFSLLSALSEQIGFNAAYLISSVSIIALLSAFFRSLTRKWWVVLLLSGLLTVLYLFIFILLALKDYAYLGGNIGLFILLAVLMMLSSKYRLFAENKEV